MGPGRPRGLSPSRSEQDHPAGAHWADRIWSPDGQFYAPPTHERLARLIWRTSRDDGTGVDLPRMSQLPPS